MILINGLVRYLILLFALGVAITVEHGHIDSLTDDTLIAMQFLMYLIAMVFYTGTLNPQTEKQLQQLRFAGRAGLVLSILIPVVISFVHFCGHIFEMAALGAFVSTAVLSIVHGTFIYYSFFHWAFGPQAFEGLPVTQKFLQIQNVRGVWRTLWLGCCYIFCSIGVVLCMGFVCVFVFLSSKALLATPIDKLVGEIEGEQYKAVNKAMDEIEAKYAADHCKLMPDKEKYKARDEVKEKHDRIDEAKIYKIYHPD